MSSRRSPSSKSRSSSAASPKDSWSAESSNPGICPIFRPSAIIRRLGEIDSPRRVGFWADTLAADPTWDEIMRLARQLLLTMLGEFSTLPAPPAAPHAKDRYSHGT
ncbi:hypothetical protein STRTUCAR8_05140 [Streptomyces turgidiscabies Car8]|uniref:Uncharacterized protein n=1 Tax=Streptomyces turgidiscabies (strain Car8) TaxID=698760 RepID=L7FJF3_STRT8|nr:hypothetical protein STRTUCAR8_05140 [Streptomyces turgidiscabies Car8]